jgi:hypothetical protein
METIIHALTQFPGYALAADILKFTLLFISFGITLGTTLYFVHCYNTKVSFKDSIDGVVFIRIAFKLIGVVLMTPMMVLIWTWIQIRKVQLKFHQV